MARSKQPNEAGKVRIISGKWRRRQLPVLAVSGLRPTPDRVRETLFNWLGSAVSGARCLDLFAGSGCLGLEAASRGAIEVTFIEKDAKLHRSLRDVVDSLGDGNLVVQRADALTWLRVQKRPFDIVFLDPPFHGQLLPEAISALHTNNLVTPGGWLYLETDDEAVVKHLPENWRVHRTGKAGQVRYYLASTLTAN